MHCFTSGIGVSLFFFFLLLLPFSSCLPRHSNAVFSRMGAQVSEVSTPLLLHPWYLVRSIDWAVCPRKAADWGSPDPESGEIMHTLFSGRWVSLQVGLREHRARPLRRHQSISARAPASCGTKLPPSAILSGPPWTSKEHRRGCQGTVVSSESSRLALRL